MPRGSEQRSESPWGRQEKLCKSKKAGLEIQGIVPRSQGHMPLALRGTDILKGF